ncbi:hypothetical protein SNE40_015430 [Patella caerulea]
MFEGKLYEGWASASTVGSIRECGGKCTIDTECQSFGINIASLNCYLYNFLIWSGSRGTTDLNMVYYWAYQKTCPVSKGYSLHESGTALLCSTIITSSATWEDAMARCYKDDGHLLIPNSQDKAAIATRLILRNLGVQFVHLGATDMNEEGVWNWLNGAPIVNDRIYTDNYDGMQHCLSYNSDRWDDQSCGLKRPFLCEIPLD